MMLSSIKIENIREHLNDLGVVKREVCNLYF